MGESPRNQWLFPPYIRKLFFSIFQGARSEERGAGLTSNLTYHPPTILSPITYPTITSLERIIPKILIMSSFPIGSKVILQNLIKGSQYNGKHGVIKTNPDGNNDGRQQVLLHDEHNIICVKPHNMKLVAEYSSNNDTTKSKKHQDPALTPSSCYKDDPKVYRCRKLW